MIIPLGVIQVVGTISSFFLLIPVPVVLIIKRQCTSTWHHGPITKLLGHDLQGSFYAGEENRF